MNKPLKIDAFTVHYHNKEELLELKSEIFSQHAYYFETDVPDPRIIDAGAHVGLATLYFKKQYPQAEITAIEPHPTNFQLLEHNIWENGLENVTCVQAALAEQSGSIEFHYDVSQSWLSTGSVYAHAWNGDQATQSSVVKSITLSSLLTQPMDLVKLDIEGAEVAVLREASSRLALVKKLLIEFHPRPDHTLADIVDLLEDHNFVLNYSKKGATVSRAQAQHGLVVIEATQRFAD